MLSKIIWSSYDTGASNRTVGCTQMLETVEWSAGHKRAHFWKFQRKLEVTALPRKQSCFDEDSLKKKVWLERKTAELWEDRAALSRILGLTNTGQLWAEKYWIRREQSYEFDEHTTATLDREIRNYRWDDKTFSWTLMGNKNDWIIL